MESRPNHVNKRVVADISDFWQFLEPWHGRWYEYKIFIASCTDNIYDLENERWLLGDMIDHVGIYGSRWPRVCRRSKSVLLLQLLLNTKQALKIPSSNDRIIIGHHTKTVPSLAILGCMNRSMFDKKVSHLDILCTQFTYSVLRPEI